jgi:hypothetical protein
VAPVIKLSCTFAPGPEFGNKSVAGLLPPVVIDPPGGTNAVALVPFGALTCVVEDAVLPPGLVVAESVIFVPPDAGDVRTTMFTDLEVPALIVPSEHVTGPVPVQLGVGAETNVVPAGKVSVTCAFETEDSLSVLVTFTVYRTSPPAVTGSGVSTIEVLSALEVTVTGAVFPVGATVTDPAFPPALL